VRGTEHQEKCSLARDVLPSTAESWRMRGEREHAHNRAQPARNSCNRRQDPPIGHQPLPPNLPTYLSASGHTGLASLSTGTKVWKIPPAENTACTAPKNDCMPCKQTAGAKVHHEFRRPGPAGRLGLCVVEVCPPIRRLMLGPPPCSLRALSKR